MDVDEESVKYFFEEEVWNSFSFYEKKRYINVKKNYDMLQSIGIKAKTPEFLLRRKREAPPSCTEYVDEDIKPDIENIDLLNLLPEDTDDSDIEFVGNDFDENLSDGENSPDESDEIDSSGPRRIQNKRARERLDLLIKGTQKNQDQIQNVLISLKLKIWKTTININKERQRRYPKRNVRRVCYTEEEVSSEDDYYYCDECHRDYDGPCPDHGPFVHVLDRKVPKESGPDRARFTRPSFVSVGRSSIRGAGLGIWVDIDLPKGVMFGPYEGTVIKTKKEAQNSGYAWEIRRRGKVSHYLQGSDSSISNWLRFVNCAPTEDRQNMMAFQYKGDIYYRTYKQVMANTEFLVWYGDEFGKDLGLCLNEELENHQGKTLMQHSQKISWDQENVFERGACMSVSTKKNISSKRCIHQNHSRERKSLTVSGLRSIQNYESNKNCYNRSITKAGNFTVKHGYTESKSLKANANNLTTPSVEASPEMDPVVNLLKTKKAEVTESNKSRKKSGDCGAECEDPTDSPVHSSHRQWNTGGNNIKIKPYKCQECNFKTAYPSNLKQHVERVHLQKRPHMCQHCDYRAQTAAHLRTHIDSVHLQKRPHMCQHCDYRAQTAGCLRTHIDGVHLQKRPHMCHHCDYQAQTAGCLRTHIDGVHLQKRPHRCEHCDYRAQTAGCLRAHIDGVHLQKRPHRCEHCDYRAQNAAHLRAHIDGVHLQKRPHTCHHCDHRAQTASDLRRHINTVHLKKRPHKCPECDYQAARTVELRGHIDAVHLKKRPYKCSVCEYEATQTSNLRRHINKIHAKNRPPQMPTQQ